MNLEQIDTSTTAGKAEVMRLAAEGRRVAYSSAGHHEWAVAVYPRWDWRTRDYAIIAEPVGLEPVAPVEPCLCATPDPMCFDCGGTGSTMLAARPEVPSVNG